MAASKKNYRTVDKENHREGVCMFRLDLDS